MTGADSKEAGGREAISSLKITSAFTPGLLFGFVIGRERVVTKASGTFVAPARTSGHTLFLYEQCLLIGTAGLHQGIAGESVLVEDGEVAVTLKPGQQAVIVWGL